MNQNNNTKTESQIEEIKLRVRAARAASFAASHSDCPSDRERKMEELTAAIDAAIAAAN